MKNLNNNKHKFIANATKLNNNSSLALFLILLFFFSARAFKNESWLKLIKSAENLNFYNQKLIKPRENFEQAVKSLQNLKRRLTWNINKFHKNH